MIGIGSERRLKIPGSDQIGKALDFEGSGKDRDWKFQG
jgi:hypothetical protein